MTTIKQCVQAAARHFDVSEIDILSARMPRHIILPRHVAYWLARETTLASYPQVGRVMRRDHTSIAVGVRKIEDRREVDAEFRSETDRLRAALMPRDLYGEEDAPAEDPRQLQLIPGGRTVHG